MNQARRADWAVVATEAGTAAISDKLRNITAVWAEARRDYLTLWDAEPTALVSLRRAVRRFENIDRLRRTLVTQLAASG